MNSYAFMRDRAAIQPKRKEKYKIQKYFRERDTYLDPIHLSKWIAIFFKFVRIFFSIRSFACLCWAVCSLRSAFSATFYFNSTFVVISSTLICSFFAFLLSPPSQAQHSVSPMAERKIYPMLTTCAYTHAHTLTHYLTN